MSTSTEKLVCAGYKITKPRFALLKYLSSHHAPLSARELHRKIKIFDQASVYRTLNLFDELGIVHVELIEKEKLYCLADTPHHHIVCKKCGYMERTECEHTFKNYKNFNSVHHQLTLTGVCNNCVVTK